MVEKGFLGRKAGKGFYLYPKDAKKGSKEKQLNPEVRTVKCSTVQYSDKNRTAIFESFLDQNIMNCTILFFLFQFSTYFSLQFFLFYSHTALLGLLFLHHKKQFIVSLSDFIITCESKTCEVTNS